MPDRFRASIDLCLKAARLLCNVKIQERNGASKKSISEAVFHKGREIIGGIRG